MINAQSLCDQLPSSIIYVAFGVYMVGDYLLGKTQFGGVLETLIESPVKAILAKFKK